MNPTLIHSNKSSHKISFIFVETLQALFTDFHASAFLICCEQARHPSCVKLFFISNSSCKIYPTRSFEMPIVSAISGTFIRRSSNIITLNKNANQMYFVLKILKIFYLHYSALHVSDTIVSIIRSFSTAHAVYGPYQL